MSVSNYKNNSCKYRIDQLDKIVYLIDENAIKYIHIDGDEAYIDYVEQSPIRFHCYNLSFEDTDVLDERYKFTHTVKMSVRGYVNYKDFQGKYYVILKTLSNEYWLVNPMFPCKLTYTYQLGHQDSHTDITLSTASNFPTLRIHNTPQGRDYPCEGYYLDGIDRLFLNERKYSAKKDNLIGYTNDGFKEVIFDKASGTFTETYNGESISHSITFNIKFDDYKDSWHYNLLEFQDNLYSAVITTKMDEYVFCGFSFGLQPSFIVTAEDNSVPNHIQITLVDAHDSGDLFTYISGATITPITETSWVFTNEYEAYECIGDGTAMYLLQKEVDALGNTTNRYKCLEGYEETFDFLIIVGTFTQAEAATFKTSLCKIDKCELHTSMTSPIMLKAHECKTYAVMADCDWSITNNASYLQISPISGSADINYNVTVCNDREITDPSVTTSITINYDSASTEYDVIIQTGDPCFPNGYVFNIDANEQYVIIPKECCVSAVTESSNTINNIEITRDEIKAFVPTNFDEEPRTFYLNAYKCGEGNRTIIINQDQMYKRWVTEGYECFGNDKCDKDRLYSGTTSGDINTYTEITRTYNCLPSTDCIGVMTRWIQTEDTICVEGRKFYVKIEQVKLATETQWIPTGNQTIGAQTEDSPAECSGSTDIQYRWVELSSAVTYYCDGYEKWTKEKKQQSTDSGATWSDVIPNEFRKGNTMVEAQSTDCGYVPPIEPQYRWVTVSGEYECSGTTKVTKEKQQVSTDSGVTWSDTGIYRAGSTVIEIDSTDCGGGVIYYRWVELPSASTYYCDGYQKWTKEQKQQSTDNVNWVDVVPSEYRKGQTMIEALSTDCGYEPIPPTPPSGTKWVAEYENGNIYSAECDSTSAITQNEIFQTNLISVVIGDCVTTIDTKAFFYYDSLSSCTIGSNVISIGNSAFEYCYGLTSIDIPSSVTSIGQYAFDYCSGLTNCTINGGSIGERAFNSCTSLTSATIGSGVTYIGNYVFWKCSGITSINIPDSVTYIGDAAFGYCSGLTSCTIGSGVISIGGNAFYECTSLTSIDIPSSVTSIGNWAFWKCSGLTSCTIGSGVTSIGQNAFMQCSSLTSIDIPDSVTSIGNSAFYQCTSLTNVTIGSGVTSIDTFAFRNCSELTSMTCLATTPPTLGNEILRGSNNCYIYVALASLDAYKSAWSEYASRIYPIP